MGRPVVNHHFVCPICKCNFIGKKKNRTYCSNKCKADSFVGKPKSKECIAKMKETMVRVGHSHGTGTYVDGYGFVKITGTNKNIHTAIAENVLGRGLKPNETVHHIDEDRTNNRNNNLVICERSLHPTIHAKMRAAK